LPSRIPASRLHDFVGDAERTAGELLRPMPQRPYAATRLGTLFHTWVEQRAATGADALDAGPFERDELGDWVDAEEFDRLRTIFESSPWAGRAPVEVEREIHLPFDGRIVVCKIDAVYADGDGFEIVDWKTGRAP